MIGKAVEVALVTIFGCAFAAAALAAAVALIADLRPAWGALAVRSRPLLLTVVAAVAGVLDGSCCALTGLGESFAAGSALVLALAGSASVSFVIRREQRPAKSGDS